MFIRRQTQPPFKSAHAQYHKINYSTIQTYYCFCYLISCFSWSTNNFPINSSIFFLNTTPFLFKQSETTDMKTFIIFLSLLVFAAAQVCMLKFLFTQNFLFNVWIMNTRSNIFLQRPETPCLYGKPEGYGSCGMYTECSEKNQECIQGVCCIVIGKFCRLT